MESSVSWRSTSTSLPSTSFFSLRTLAAFSVQPGYSRNCFARYALQYFPISAMGDPPHFLIDSISVSTLEAASTCPRSIRQSSARRKPRAYHCTSAPGSPGVTPLVKWRPLAQVAGGGLVRVVAWYDNEWGYAHRLADLLGRLARENRGRTEGEMMANLLTLDDLDLA